MSAPTGTAPSPPTARVNRRRLAAQPGQLFDLLFVPGVLVLLCVYLALTNPVFLTSGNIVNILLQASILAIASFGMTFAILGRELDLSVGTGSALASVIAAMVMVNTGSILLGVAAGLGFGLVLGATNGFLVTKVEVPSFIATLGAFIVCQGIALALTNGGVIFGLPEGVAAFADLRILGLPALVWCTAIVFLVLYFLQKKTVFGAQVMAVGGNPEAARLSGISVNRVRFLIFIITGTTAALAGLALLVRVQSGQPNANQLLALEAIAAVVVGGTSLNGGRGSVARTLWGVLLIAVLRNGLDLMGLNEDTKMIVIGVVFIIAASVDFMRRQFLKRRYSDKKTASDPGDIGGVSLAEPPAGGGDGSPASGRQSRTP